MMTREQLEALSNEELLGKEQMAELREEAIGESLAAQREKLEALSDEELLWTYLDDLRGEEIERRLGISDDQ